MDVANGPAFASSPNATLAVQDGIAKTLGVDPSDVAVTCSSNSNAKVQCNYAVTLPNNSPANAPGPAAVAAAMLGDRPSGTNLPLLNNLQAAISAGINPNDPNLQLGSVTDVNYPSQNGGPPEATIKGTMDMVASNGNVFVASPAALLGVAQGIAKTVGVDPNMVAVNCASNQGQFGTVSCSYTIAIPPNSLANVTKPSIVAAILFGDRPLASNVPFLNTMQTNIASAIGS